MNGNLEDRVKNLENDMMLIRDGTIVGKVDDSDKVDGIEATDLDYKTTYKCRIYLGTNQNNIPNDTYTKVLLDTKNYDPSEMVDLANNKIIILVPGYYLVSGSIRFISLGTDKAVVIGFYKNGVIMDYPKRYLMAAFSNFTINATDIIHFDKDDYIELYARHKNEDNTPDIEAGKGYTFMAVHLLSKD